MPHDELIDRFQEAWCERDLAAFAGVCAPDVHYEDPLVQAPTYGPDELARHVAGLWAAFPDLALRSIGDRLGDHRRVAAPFELTGTQHGELAGLPASGRRVRVQGVFWCELERHRERLWRVRAFYDLYGAATALGVLPRPGGLGERALLMLRGYGWRGVRRSGTT